MFSSARSRKEHAKKMAAAKAAQSYFPSTVIHNLTSSGGLGYAIIKLDQSRRSFEAPSVTLIKTKVTAARLTPLPQVPSGISPFKFSLNPFNLISFLFLGLGWYGINTHSTLNQIPRSYFKFVRGAGVDVYVAFHIFGNRRSLLCF